VDQVTFGVSTAERTIALTPPTRSALGLSELPAAERDVVAGALRLLEHSAGVPEVMPMQVFLDSIDELVLGVVEAVEECVVSPPRDCVDLRARAEVEAARWVDDFLADDVTDERSVAAQQAMFVLAQVLADAVADALAQRAVPPAPTTAGGLVVEIHRQVLAGVRRVIRLGEVVWTNGLGLLRAIRSDDAGRRADDLSVVGVRTGDD